MSATLPLVGRLTADPELRFSPSGMAVAKFTIVTSRRTKNEATGEWADADTTFWDCAAFKQLAENIAETLQKGMEVVAIGRAVQENWEDKQTGAKRSKVSVRIDSIGPNLSRATAKVAKAQAGGQGQQQGGQQSQQRGGGQPDPWASNAPQQSQGGWGAPQQQGGGFSDEPPF
jgi:single-strand DNA-binding protein